MPVVHRYGNDLFAEVTNGLGRAARDERCQRRLHAGGAPLLARRVLLLDRREPRILGGGAPPVGVWGFLTGESVATTLRLVETMKTVGASEAKTHLPRLLEEVARGESIRITRHGAAVTILVPAASGRHGHAAETISALRAFSANRRLGRRSVKAMIEEGRR